MRSKRNELHILTPTKEDELLQVERWAHPVSRAAWRGSLDVVLLAVGYGVDPDYQNPAGNTPLALAAYSGHIDVVYFLLSHGARPGLKDIYRNNSPLTHAAGEGHGEVGKRPLIHAARQCRPDTVKLLIECGADFNMVNHKGDSVLSAAARTGDVPLLQLLLDLGVDMDLCVLFGQCTSTIAMQSSF
ncbi:ankyrin repeat domain-containing protein [Aspergillus glaucus CBS 516.65]|uniref:Uncharacterized protein n=1 Tax=Aspergillus glaucus CBS 516.65 TaxID=1160497 RepID=A0A1L9VF63_ASPGL|nr:hypothetical protein ASPGLDRAFT_37284 [Aspergillus glaucus CBS 516.65]OJJ82550.1 hypothetical protein ASPGLDRAFT_37284 [Aspergillus glaucus CBS 516.65]